MDNDPLSIYNTAEALDPSKRRAVRADLCEAPQCNASPTQQSPSTKTDDIDPITHPAAFSFPTLSPDGSIDDISSAPLLSQSTMADHDGLSDTSSQADGYSDSQYDFVEDASDLSTGDTASVASTEHVPSDDGLETQEDTHSVEGGEWGIQTEQDIVEDVDGDKVVLSPGYFTGGYAGRPLATTRNSATVNDDGDELIDSYLSDDLTTPRQSTLQGDKFSSSSYDTLKPASPSSSAKSNRSSERWRVLFVADCDLPESEMHTVCAKITSSISGSDSSSGCRILKLPATPAGNEPSSATIFNEGNSEMHVQRCVKVDAKDEGGHDGPEYALHILDSDPEYSTIYKVGSSTFGKKLDFDVPSLAIVYISASVEHAQWVGLAKKAMKSLGVPTLTIRANNVNPLCLGTLCDYDAEDLLQEKASDLRQILQNLLERKHEAKKALLGCPPTKRNKKPLKNEKKKANFAEIILTKWFAMASLSWLFIMTISIFLANPTARSSLDPVSHQAVRREALEAVLVQLTGNAEATKTFNLDRLLPTPTPMSTTVFGSIIYDVPEESYFQGVAPNHIVASLRKSPETWCSPYAKSVRVSKNGNDIHFNETRLIDGVYYITIDPLGAFGNVDIKMVTSCPVREINMRHNFGHRMLQRETYQKARTDLSKTMSKDLITARQAALSFHQKLKVELAAGASATMNITKQLAVYASRDLQLFSTQASSLLGQFSRKGNATLQKVRTDLTLYKKELARFSDSLKTQIPTPKQALAPLKLARERAAAFKQKVDERIASKRANDPNRAAAKSLSTIPGKGLLSSRSPPPEKKEKKASTWTLKKHELAIRDADKEVKKLLQERERDAETTRKRQARLLQRER
ncbi:hypothetical protein KC318_g3433 [Hortaea werneckii]|uniref:Uncharacterized protein n=1 Tax=Hortaea werneckii TaxID=91943 RepID=A0A3M6ZV35_HORWE|nr:hypothetical protein KC334_g3370 [Hortaea werneckii]KAI7017388.1 hypothetical protein KC355_g3703 [Hortaea werneckii]KAI7671534.1 hypothetical protein KC318_g3433 [Hortaea werneckii]RMY19083.1 hypothetical protein D0867_04901 [Hortaea werneckii]RMY34397.1 hypothetical protein D0866_05279 [Hortaea werneckii]